MTHSNENEILYESFEMFKDDWDENSETLILIISKISDNNINTAIKMWEYLLLKHSKIIKTDDEITSGVFYKISEDNYDDIIKSSVIMEKLFKESSEPWNAVGIIRYLIKGQEYYLADRLLNLIYLNESTLEYNFKTIKSSNLATSLYHLLNYGVSEFTKEESEYISLWIEKIEDSAEKMKLKVLLLTKEIKSNTSTSYIDEIIKDNTNLRYDSLDDFELPSVSKDKYEIRRIIEILDKDDINIVDFSRLSISWIENIFKENKDYVNGKFNLIGAYYLVEIIPFKAKAVLSSKYKDNKKNSRILRESNIVASVQEIEQILELMQKEMNHYRHIWNLNYLSQFCENIINLSKEYNYYIEEKAKAKENILNKYKELDLESLNLSNRIIKNLIKSDIYTLDQVINILDWDIKVEGLGLKSIEVLEKKIKDLGVKIESVEDDFKFVFDYLNIDYDENLLGNIGEVSKMLKLEYNMFIPKLSRSEFRKFIDNQTSIAEKLLSMLSEKECNLHEVLTILKSDCGVYLPWKFFFINLNKKNVSYTYYL